MPRNNNEAIGLSSHREIGGKSGAHHDSGGDDHSHTSPIRRHDVIERGDRELDVEW